MPLTHERKFRKKVLMKNLKFLLFPIYVPATLLKPKLQVHPANLTNPDILKFTTKFLEIKCSWKFKVCPSFTRSFKCKKSHPEMFDIMEYKGNS